MEMEHYIYLESLKILICHPGEDEMAKKPSPANLSLLPLQKSILKTWLAFGHILEHLYEFKENSFETLNLESWKVVNGKKHSVFEKNLTMSYYKSLPVKRGGGRLSNWTGCPLHIKLLFWNVP
jgi:hypothetical protein